MFSRCKKFPSNLFNWGSLNNVDGEDNLKRLTKIFPLTCVCAVSASGLWISSFGATAEGVAPDRAAGAFCCCCLINAAESPACASAAAEFTISPLSIAAYTRRHEVPGDPRSQNRRGHITNLSLAMSTIPSSFPSQNSLLIDLIPTYPERRVSLIRRSSVILAGDPAFHRIFAEPGARYGGTRETPFASGIRCCGLLRRGSVVSPATLRRAHGLLSIRYRPSLRHQIHQPRQIGLRKQVCVN